MRVLWVYNGVLSAMNNQDGPGCDVDDIPQWLDLVKMVTCTPVQQVVRYPGDGSRWHTQCAAEIVINDPQCGSKSAIHYQRFNIFVASAGHNSHCRAH